MEEPLATISLHLILIIFVMSGVINCGAVHDTMIEEVVGVSVTPVGGVAMDSTYH